LCNKEPSVETYNDDAKFFNDEARERYLYVRIPLDKIGNEINSLKINLEVLDKQFPNKNNLSRSTIESRKNAIQLNFESSCEYIHNSLNFQKIGDHKHVNFSDDFDKEFATKSGNKHIDTTFFHSEKKIMAAIALKSENFAEIRFRVFKTSSKYSIKIEANEKIFHSFPILVQTRGSRDSGVTAKILFDTAKENGLLDELYHLISNHFSQNITQTKPNNSGQNIFEDDQSLNDSHQSEAMITTYHNTFPNKRNKLEHSGTYSPKSDVINLVLNSNIIQTNCSMIENPNPPSLLNLSSESNFNQQNMGNVMVVIAVDNESIINWDHLSEYQQIANDDASIKLSNTVDIASLVFRLFMKFEYTAVFLNRYYDHQKNHYKKIPIDYITSEGEKISIFHDIKSIFVYLQMDIRKWDLANNFLSFDFEKEYEYNGHFIKCHSFKLIEKNEIRSPSSENLKTSEEEGISNINLIAASESLKTPINQENNLPKKINPGLAQSIQKITDDICSGQMKNFIFTGKQVKGPLFESIYQGIEKCNDNLIGIDLSMNSISSEEVIRLFEILKNKHSLEELNLKWNPIDNGCIQSLKNLLEVNKTIRIVDLHRTNISPDYMNQVSEILSSRNQA